MGRISEWRLLREAKKQKKLYHIVTESRDIKVRKKALNKLCDQEYLRLLALTSWVYLPDSLRLVVLEKLSGEEAQDTYLAMVCELGFVDNTLLLEAFEKINHSEQTLLRIALCKNVAPRRAAMERLSSQALLKLVIDYGYGSYDAPAVLIERGESASLEKAFWESERDDVRRYICKNLGHDSDEPGICGRCGCSRKYEPPPPKPEKPPMEINCPSCGGTGEVEFVQSDSGAFSYRVERCESCDGSGVVWR